MFWVRLVIEVNSFVPNCGFLIKVRRWSDLLFFANGNDHKAWRNFTPFLSRHLIKVETAPRSFVEFLCAKFDWIWTWFQGFCRGKTAFSTGPDQDRSNPWSGTENEQNLFLSRIESPSRNRILLEIPCKVLKTVTISSSFNSIERVF